MSFNLCDETIPASLLIEFDELDDEIPISPELPKRHQPERFLRDHTALSDDKGIVTDKTNIVDDRNGSRMVISGSSNTSSGHSSLSTEGENRSASSDRDTSRDLSKRQPSDVGSGALLLLGDPRSAKLSLKSRKIRQPRSMESLLQNQGQSVGQLKLASPLGSGTGLGAGKGMGGGSTGNVSVRSIGGIAQQQLQQQQQHYHRHRSKYGHVQSKVKQMIDEMKPPTNRKSLVRHKSMPETSYDVDVKAEGDDTVEQENDVETLQSIVREMRLHMSSLEQELSVCRTDLFNELSTLKYKNSALRLENDHLLEQERAREQHRQVLREQQQTGGSCYGSQSSLYKTSVKTTCTVATQTSPSGVGDQESLFEFLLASPPLASPPALPHQTSPSPIELESAVGEFSPDYEQLIPMLGRSGTARVLGSGIRNREVRRTPSFRSPTGRRSESGQAGDFAHSPTCHDCRRRKKKRKSRKQKLASLFCIRHHDESL